MPRAILFDLDGTLVDTRAASWDLFAETNAAFGLGIDTREAFFKAFENNFFDTLATLPIDAARLQAAKQHFLQALRSRYHPPFIPGMVDVVRALAPQCTLAVVSTNDIGAIRRILVEAGLATCFSHVFSGDVEPRKSVSIRRFLGDHGYIGQRLCAPSYSGTDEVRAPLNPDEVVLVTDTVGDIAEALEVGVLAIGVAWGMHSEAQLLEAGARRVALWPQELLAWLGGEAAQATDAPDAQGNAVCTGAAGGCSCQTGPGDAAPRDRLRDEVSRAGALRRDRQLGGRLQSGVPMTPRGMPSDPGHHAAQDELRQALARIMGGPP